VRLQRILDETWLRRAVMSDTDYLEYQIEKTEAVVRRIRDMGLSEHRIYGKIVRAFEASLGYLYRQQQRKRLQLESKKGRYVS